MKKIEKQIARSIKVIQRFCTSKPEIGLISGSGLGALADFFEKPVKIPYTKIPFFPVSTVEGHSNILCFGRIYNLNVVVMKGRFHYYEGYGLDRITYPVRVIKNLGVKKIIITNASGGVNPKFKTGDIMVITDHINLMGSNPLIGWKREDLAPRFIDMTFAYSQEMIKSFQKAASKNKIKIQKGVYAAVSGPSYETPAEIKMLAKMGADAVGMSTVPEVIVACQLKMDVLGISLITNMAAGILKKKLDHKDVLKLSNETKDKFVRLIKGFLEEYKKYNYSTTKTRRHEEAKG